MCACNNTDIFEVASSTDPLIGTGTLYINLCSYIFYYSRTPMYLNYKDIENILNSSISPMLGFMFVLYIAIEAYFT